MQESNFSFELSNDLRTRILASDPNNIPPRQAYLNTQFQAAMAAAINTFKLQSAIMYPVEANFTTGLFGVLNLSKNIPAIIDPTYNQAYPDMLAKDPQGFATSLGIAIPANVLKFSYFVMTYNGITTDEPAGGKHLAMNTTTIVVFIYTTT